MTQPIRPDPGSHDQGGAHFAWIENPVAVREDLVRLMGLPLQP